MRFKLILPWMMVAAATSPALAAAGRYPISTAQIAAAVSSLGMQVAPQQVTLLSDVVSNSDSPRLTVRSIEPWGNRGMMARLACESSDQCLPFLVSLKMAPGADTHAAMAAAQASLPILASSPKHFAVRSGTPATLLLDSERVHIRLSVICLESGVLGQTIRVTDRDRRTVFRAQVVDGGLLKGRL